MTIGQMVDRWRLLPMVSGIDAPNAMHGQAH